MDRLWALATMHVGAVGEPVGGDAKDGTRPRQFFPLLYPTTSELVVFEGVGRAAVADKKHGQEWARGKVRGEGLEVVEVHGFRVAWLRR